jgi:HlyD family secretion protein
VLYAAGDVSLQGFQEAEAKLKEARSNYEAAELKYKDAASRINEAGENVNEEYYSADDRFYQAQIEEEESQIRMLDEKIERCSIRAEQDGIVTDLPAASITRVQQGDKLVTITGDSERRLEVNVLTNKEPYLKVGDKVSMTHRLKSDYNTYDGVITAIDSYAEKSVSALGADEYRVRVCVDVSGIEKLKEGYELDAQFTTYHSEDAISVPNSALFTKDGQDCLFTVSGGRAHLKQVEVRHRGNIRSEISSGLSDGEIIIVDANQKELEDGAAVAEA